MESKKMTDGRRPSRFGDISQSAKHVGRVIAFLTREQLDFIDKISKDALFSTGHKLSRIEIIQAIVEIIRRLDFSGKDIHSTDELEQRIMDVAKKALPEIRKELKKGDEDEPD